MKSRLPLRIQAIAVLLVALAFHGCTGVARDPGAASSATRAAAATETGNVPVELRQGMTPAQVRDVLGTPARTRPVRSPAGEAERWVYIRDSRTDVRQVVAGTKDVPYVDPFTGEVRTIPEPTYADEAVTTTEELHLFWLDDELVEWKTEYRTGRSYTR